MNDSGSNSPSRPTGGRRSAKQSHKDGSSKTEQNAVLDLGQGVEKAVVDQANQATEAADCEGVMAGPGSVNSPNIQRTFLGWSRPVLVEAVERLFERHAKAGEWDLRRWTIVLPSGLARRRLQELLALRAQQSSLVLYPPQIVTVGQLPEYLYVAQFPFASDLVQVLTWVSALQATPMESLQQILPQPPHRDATEQWLELGRMLSGLHRELASDSLDFEMVQKALINHPESPRWQALSGVQKRYLDKLRTLGLWDVQTARLTALRNKEPQTDRQILVIGAVDLNRTQRGFLQAVAANVEVWVAAPIERSDAFDDYGCVVADRWQEASLTLNESQLWVGNTPSDIAELTAACLADLGDRYHARDLTLGVPDISIVPIVQHHLSLANIHARHGAGTPLVQSEPARLLILIGKYLKQRTFQSFADLVRHPAIENVLSQQRIDVSSDWLAILDQYSSEAVPRVIDDHLCEKLDGSHVYHDVTEAINKWLGKLNGRSQPLSAWVQPILQVMRTAYLPEKCDLEDAEESQLYHAASQLCDMIVSLRDIPPALEPKLTVGEFIDWIASSMAGKLVPEPTDASALEMLGWLELALDDAAGLVIAGLHDGVVPESANADAFLPNQLRRQLGMMDNAARYARDMYALQVMVHARQFLKIIVGKTDHQGDPLVPSRLLLACDLAELPGRVLRLVSEDTVDTRPPVETRWKAVHGASQIPIPKPGEVKVPRTITVTAFRDYLQCPYRFYLRHVLKLREQVDVGAELDARQFGNLLHDTLALLHGNPISQSDNPDAVEEFLVLQLHRLATEKFGAHAPAGVLIQIEQAEQRLRAFAAHQARHAGEGWQIHCVEKGVELEDRLLIGDSPKAMTLIGRIDRIDFNPQTRQWAIWDYKTSDNAKEPVKVHWTKDAGWKDLQLTLYRKIAPRLGADGPMQVGYIVLPKQSRDTGFAPADFTSEQLAQADQLAIDVVADIQAGKFWPDQLEEVEFDSFSKICQTRIRVVDVAAPEKATTSSLVARSPIAEETIQLAQQRLQSPPATSPEGLFEPEMIRASAGTGKTFQLSNRLLQIILSGQEVDHVLATTFTRKAAGEIMHRVLQRLANACFSDREDTGLASFVKGVDTSPAACLAALRKLTRQLHRFRVSTLDSFFAQIARTFSLEMMLPPGWSPLDPVQEPIAQMQAVQDMLDSHDRKTLVNLVRMLAKGDSQRQVAEQVLGTVRAGYGAFRVTDRATWDQMPLPSAPEKSELQEALTIIEAPSITHQSILVQFRKLLVSVHEGDWESVISHGAFAHIDQRQPTYYNKDLPEEVCSALRIIRRQAAASLLPIRRDQTLASYDVLDAYDKQYAALTRRQRTLAFSDVSYLLSRWMLPRMHDGATSTPVIDPRQLQLRLDCHISHLLLDEFQDTSPEQWQILRPLAEPLAVPHQTDRSFFCVGDTKQAIYGWRGGVAEIFESVTRSLAAVQQSQLNLSYRSSPQVMEVVNEVFTNLTRHNRFANCDRVAHDWSSEFPEHRTAKQDLVGYVCLQNGPNIDPSLSNDERRTQLMEFAANQIAELTSRTDAGVGVLFRRNADVAAMIGMLRDRRVSASQDGGNPLTDSIAVDLVLSLVHLAEHPGDGICAFHLGNSPLASSLPYHPLTHPAELARWFRQRVARSGLGRAIEAIADSLAASLSWWDQHRLRQLVQSAHQYQVAGSGRLTDFERAVAEQRIALPSESQVKVMTIHKSKGLEFDSVFLPDLAMDLVANPPLLVLRGNDPCQPPDGVLRYMNEDLQRVLPDSWQTAFQQTRERGVFEGLCTLYVAMTRARQALYMYCRPGKSPRQEFDSMLQSILANPDEIGQAEAILYQQGDPKWYQHGTSKTSMDRSVDSKANHPLAKSTIRIRTDLSTAPQRSLRISSPSTVGKSTEPMSLADAFNLSHAYGASYGKLIHAFFQQVQWLDNYSLNAGALHRVALSALTPEELRHVKLDRVTEAFAEMLQLRSVRSALSLARYQRPFFGTVADRVEVDNERPVNLIVNDRLITGTIDRLVILMKNGKPFAAEIIDLKTDAFDENMTLLWVQDRIEFHRPQLEIYSQIVAQMLSIPLERVTPYLLLLNADELAACPVSTGHAHAPRLRPSMLDNHPSEILKP